MNIHDVLLKESSFGKVFSRCVKIKNVEWVKSVYLFNIHFKQKLHIEQWGSDENANAKSTLERAKISTLEIHLVPQNLILAHILPSISFSQNFFQW